MTAPSPAAPLPLPEGGGEGLYYIVDMRPEWSKKAYITVWRPDNKGYAFPLSWAGKYNKEIIEAGGSYYFNKGGTSRYVRFPVPCAAVESLATARPAKGHIDGDAGPVLLNHAAVREALIAARYIPTPPSRPSAGGGDE